MKTLYIPGALLLALLLMGAGCSSVPEDHGQDSYYYGDYEDSYDDYDSYYEDDYDSYDSYDSYNSYDSSIPQGYQDVYACNLTSDYCEYIEANISGDTISSIYTSYYIYPGESLCDSVGCYFIDDMRNEWYFDF